MLRVLLIEGLQTAKVVVDPSKLDDDHGFPPRVLTTWPEGIPLDLNPSWPLELDVDSDPRAFYVALSFGGRVCRCRVTWKAVSMIAVGIGGVVWQHEGERPEAVTEPPPSADRPKGAHLRVLK